MPIYLDRHDTPEEITPEHVAEMHQADLKVQDEFGCRGFTYWFDNKRKSGFCLIEAPNKEALIKMHDHAHGAVPHQIIEVEEGMVEAFLGRLEDPKKAKNEKLNIIDEPAFRTLMLINYKEFSSAFDLHEFNKILLDLINQYDGSIVKNRANSILSSFFSVSKAVDCAMAINKEIRKNKKNEISFKIGLNCGVPVVDNKENIFEETITSLNRICAHVKDDIVLASEVIDLYNYENNNKNNTKGIATILSISEQNFLNCLIDFVEGSWNKADLKVDDFASNLGLSKSQVYRKLKILSGKSPNEFIRDYRLDKAISMLKKGDKSISETAFEIGFNSPSYFSKCFQKKFGTLPSSYIT